MQMVHRIVVFLLIVVYSHKLRVMDGFMGLHHVANSFFVGRDSMIIHMLLFLIIMIVLVTFYVEESLVMMTTTSFNIMSIHTHNFGVLR